MNDITPIGLTLLAVGAFLIRAAALMRGYSRGTRQLARLESKLDRMLEHSGVEFTDDLRRVLELLEEGRAAEAVREYRRTTGSDLVTAKRAVDDMLGDERRPGSR